MYKTKVCSYCHKHNNADLDTCIWCYHKFTDIPVSLKIIRVVLSIVFFGILAALVIL